jgi:hypothetical protein
MRGVDFFSELLPMVMAMVLGAVIAVVAIVVLGDGGKNPYDIILDEAERMTEEANREVLGDSARITDHWPAVVYSMRTESGGCATYALVYVNEQFIFQVVDPPHECQGTYE